MSNVEAVEKPIISAKIKVFTTRITDNDSTKIKNSRGVSEGYTDGVAVDANHQVIVQAQTYGKGQVYVPVAERREVIEKHPHL